LTIKIPAQQQAANVIGNQFDTAKKTMTEEQLILIDILKIVPDSSTCFINAPSIDEGSAILNLLTASSNYDWTLILSTDNKKNLSDIITVESIQDYFHKLDIKNDNSLLCESFDGMTTVILSEKLNIPDWFANKYVRDGNCWNMR
jgi:hypothetical protein